MNKTKTILISLGIILINHLNAHFFAPNGITFTPIVVIIISVLIGQLNDDLKPITKSILLAGLISIHDIGIKLFSGGSHDSQGLGWINLMLIIGVVPSFILLANGVFKTKDEPKINKWNAIIIFPILIWFHLLIFSELGLGRYY